MATNRLLTDKDREELKPIIEELFRVCPDTMKRKIARANVQQAFILGAVLDQIAQEDFHKVLSVGHYDDTAYEYLKSFPFSKLIDLVGVDPAINIDLHSFRNGKTTKDGLGFDIIFSTSVIEHVQNDEEFLDDICKLLNKGGVGILTMDFNNDYRPGDKLPHSNIRFYTKKDLEFRLTKILTNNGCDLVDIPDWSGEPEFTHDGCNYSFATFVFRKNE